MNRQEDKRKLLPWYEGRYSLSKEAVSRTIIKLGISNVRSYVSKGLINDDYYLRACISDADYWAQNERIGKVEVKIKGDNGKGVINENT